MSNEGPFHTLDRITRRARVRALEVTPPTLARLSASQLKLLGSVHIPVVNHYEGITDEQIMKITIPYGVMQGSSRAVVVDNSRKMNQARAVEYCAAEAI